ncbi:MAG: TPM domain-containing protein [candidate division NC10 bacterium]|nr:TPM domain-containing protein [candidate division NC10 bacterium]
MAGQRVGEREGEVAVKKLLLLPACLLLLLCLPSPSPSQGVTIPSPLGYVNDYAGVIDPATETALTNLIKAVEQKTTAEIAILTVETTKPLETFQYSIQVFDQWKIGKKGKDNQEEVGK